MRLVVLAAALLAFLICAFAPLMAQFDLPGDIVEEEPQYVQVHSLLSSTSLQPGSTYQAATVVVIAHEWHINSVKPFEDWLIPAKLSFDTVAGLTPHDIIYPTASQVTLAGDKMSVYHDSVVVRFQVTVDDTVTPGDYTLPVRFEYQPCNDKVCLAPQTISANLEAGVGAGGTPVHGEVFAAGAAVATQVETPVTAPPEQDNDLQRLINEHGFWGYLLALGIAFVTGLLLSFSPCTYPMVPITVSIFAGQDRSVGRGFILSLFYVGSMAAMYGIMGLIVSLVGGVFGAWLASTPVVIGIAIVFVIFSLSMFGFYELQVPNFLRQKLGTAAGGGGVIGCIVLGIIAALVVSPCVGPFVAGILLYVATSGSPILGFLVLFVFALGLGTLYVLIATFSTSINKLPGAGAWMESVKRFFGFVLLLMAIYFLRTILPTSLTAILTALILLAFAVFGGGLDRLSPDSGAFARLKKFLGIIALLAGAYLFLGSLISQGLILPPAAQWLPSGNPAGVQHEKELIDWETDLESGLNRARTETKPVLIDTWATWCVNCRVLDKKTFGHPDVAAEAQRFVPIKVQLEKAGSETTKDFMSRFGIKQYSLPTTLLIDSQGNVRRMLQGIVEPDEIIAEMKRIQ